MHSIIKNSDSMNFERNFQYSEMVKTVNQMRCAAQSGNVNWQVWSIQVHLKELPIQTQISWITFPMSKTKCYRAKLPVKIYNPHKGLFFFQCNIQSRQFYIVVLHNNKSYCHFSYRIFFESYRMENFPQ